MTKGKAAQNITRFKISITLIVLGSLMICLIPYARFDGDTTQRFMAYAIGMFFWVFTIAGYLMLWAVNSSRKASSQKTTPSRRKMPGALRFFSSREAIVADLIALVLLGVTVILFINRTGTNLLSVTVCSMLILFVQLRAIINGQNYMYIKQLSGRFKSNEKKDEL